MLPCASVRLAEGMSHIEVPLAPRQMSCSYSHLHRLIAPWLRLCVFGCVEIAMLRAVEQLKATPHQESLAGLGTGRPSIAQPPLHLTTSRCGSAFLLSFCSKLHLGWSFWSTILAATIISSSEGTSKARIRAVVLWMRHSKANPGILQHATCR